MRIAALISAVLVVAAVLLGCGADREEANQVPNHVTAREAREALARLPWSIRLVASKNPKVIAARATPERNVHFRFVVLVGDRDLRDVRQSLPAAYRPLVEPDFGSASLLANGPFIYVSNAGKRAGARLSRNRELSVSDGIEEVLCRLSSNEACPAL